MKATELMIGDWVRVIPYKKNGRIYRIDYTYGKGNEYVGVIDGDFDIGLLEPIPLTPEILEKNGFVEADVVVVGTRKMKWESEDCRTEITIWMDDSMPMDIRKNIYYEDEVCYTLPFACTVHELQHAIRLCGIEKEIEL